MLASRKTQCMTLTLHAHQSLLLITESFLSLLRLLMLLCVVIVTLKTTPSSTKSRPLSHMFAVTFQSVEQCR